MKATTTAYTTFYRFDGPLSRQVITVLELRAEVAYCAIETYSRDGRHAPATVDVIPLAAIPASVTGAVHGRLKR